MLVPNVAKTRVLGQTYWPSQQIRIMIPLIYDSKY